MRRASGNARAVGLRQVATPAPLALELRALYPSLTDLPLESTALEVLDVSAGTRLFDAGAPCAGFPLVLEGEIQVSRAASDGRQLELYRVGPGEICIVSAAGLMSNRPLNAQGTAAARTRLAMMPPNLFARWNDHKPFRQFVFGVFADRLGDLMTLVDAVAFHRLDERLAGFLLERGRVIHTTHQALADELGTVREIITRLLNRFESAGAVKLGRERIEIVNATALQSLSGSALKSP
ncbi:MAG: Crp/Fnr family transcriptional regulator [Proteobacteria bacterium]|nr:Crp/Fnr family transcriptional regulator [Pseudomonadota bacterium]